MTHKNSLVSFLRHYGPIPASDNMYDELIQSEIEHHAIEPALHIDPVRLNLVRSNFESTNPQNVILTGTAGDGKTYHCRRIWEHFEGDRKKWKDGNKIVSLPLPASGKTITIVKDLSELTQREKNAVIADLSVAVAGKNEGDVFLIAANDGQLLATWRDWSGTQNKDARKIFKIVENMLIEKQISNNNLSLALYNLSCLDASVHFQSIIEKIIEHPQWEQCKGCDLLNDNGTSSCPIRINRERLRGGDASIFRKRICDLIKLSSANRKHIPIRDIFLLSVNILLGDQQNQQILLTCKTAKIRAKKGSFQKTNPYSNVFGANLAERQRQQYQVFTILDEFGIGRETDNKFDNLLIYGKYSDSDHYKKFISNDTYYGARDYERYLRDYLEGERENVDDFMHALGMQRQRLFFSLPIDNTFDPWNLTVYRASGLFLNFVSGLASDTDVSQTVETLIKGLNRIFCGMMIDEGTQLYLASSGGDGRGRVTSILNYSLPIEKNSRNPYLQFTLSEDDATPCLQIIDPVYGKNCVLGYLNLQLTHFEYLVRVASGSLPASFSRQCNEDFLDFKLRLINRLDKTLDAPMSTSKVNFQTLTVDEKGRVHPENIQIRVRQ